MIHDFLYLFLKVGKIFFFFVSGSRARFAAFFAVKIEEKNIFDGIVAIKILFKLHAFRRSWVESEERKEEMKQAVKEHNLWFLLAYLVMVKCLIGNLSNFTYEANIGE